MRAVPLFRCMDGIGFPENPFRKDGKIREPLLCHCGEAVASREIGHSPEDIPFSKREFAAQFNDPF